MQTQPSEFKEQTAEKCRRNHQKGCVKKAVLQSVTVLTVIISLYFNETTKKD